MTFLGLRSDVSRILNNLDVFVLSSHTEGFSIACIEAMACGVPVVATRSGGPEQILEGEAGTSGADRRPRLTGWCDPTGHLVEGFGGNADRQGNQARSRAVLVDLRCSPATRRCSNDVTQHNRAEPTASR